MELLIHYYYLLPYYEKHSYMATVMGWSYAFDVRTYYSLVEGHCGKLAIRSLGHTPRD